MRITILNGHPASTTSIDPTRPVAPPARTEGAPEGHGPLPIPYNSAGALDAYLVALKIALEHGGQTVDIHPLAALSIKPCIGCFGCWVKTPGRCVFDDESARICRAFLGADLVLFASPVLMGFVSAKLKIVMDKLIPVLMPYITIIGGECHHVPRYDRDQYPLLGVLLDTGPPSTDTALGEGAGDAGGTAPAARGAHGTHDAQGTEGTDGTQGVRSAYGADEEDLAIIRDIFQRFAINFHSEIAVFKQTSEPIEEVVDAIVRL